MNFLEELYLELESVQPSEELNLNLDTLLDDNFDALSNEAKCVIGLIEALENNFNYHIAGKETVSLESYQAYTAATEAIILASGLDIPVSVVAPSFEATADMATSAGEQKGNVIQRAWDAFLTLLKRIWEALRSIWTKDDKKTEDLVKEIRDTTEKVSEGKNVYSDTVYEVTIPKALENGWGYNALDAAFNDAMNTYRAMFDKLDLIYKSKDLDQINKYIAELDEMGLKISNITKDPELNKLIDGTVKVSGTVDKLMSIFKSATKLDAIAAANTKLHKQVSAHCDGWLDMMQRNKRKAKEGAVTIKMHNKLADKINWVNGDLKRISSRQMARTVSVHTVVDRIGKIADNDVAKAGK